MNCISTWKKPEISGLSNLFTCFTVLIKKLKMEKLFSDSQILQYGKTWVNSYSENLLRIARAPVYGIDMFNLFRDSKIILNFHIGIAGDYAGNMRMFRLPVQEAVY